MRRRASRAAGRLGPLVAATAALLPAAGAPAGPPGGGSGGLLQGLSLYLADTARLEHWRFFDPGPLGGDPGYDFVANRLRLGARIERPRFRLHAAAQYVQLASVPDDAAGAVGGALGTGALYFGHSGERHPEAVQLKYLSLELRRLLDRDLSVELGRFGHSSGREAQSGVAKIEALKRSRIADRLIGEFGWSHFQRSFDGVRAHLGLASGHASFAAFRPTEGGFEDGGTRRIDAIDVATAAYTWRPDRLVPGAEVQAFYVLYSDERRVRARADNTGLPARDRLDLHIHTAGGHLAGAWPLGPGELDVVAWGALQTGRWQGLDHRAGALALEAGYQLTRAPGTPWLRVGGFRSSGDGAPGDGEHETFFQILPTARLYAFTAAYNLMNSTDHFVELRLAPTSRLTLQADVHDLRLSQQSDRWYAGAGATQARGTIFGYAGRPSGGHRHLGTAAELAVRYRASDWLGVHAFYGHLFGGNVVEATFRDDDLDFFFLELTFRKSVGAKPGASPQAASLSTRGGAPGR